VAIELVRAGLLEGQAIVLAPGAAPLDDDATAAAAQRLERVDVLVDDAAARFAAGGLRAAADCAWIAPGDASSADDVAALVAFLASPAGDYYSGCRFTLGEAVPT
jgi:NAD(P)-dependent dehydrogenase (short-subunit alcohol dehydrogenase family)